MSSIERSFDALSEALNKLESELASRLDDGLVTQESLVAVGKHSRNARNSAQKASEELSQSIQTLKEMIAAAKQS